MECKPQILLTYMYLFVKCCTRRCVLGCLSMGTLFLIHWVSFSSLDALGQLEALAGSGYFSKLIDSSCSSSCAWAVLGDSSKDLRFKVSCRWMIAARHAGIDLQNPSPTLANSEMPRLMAMAGFRPILSARYVHGIAKMHSHRLNVDAKMPTHMETLDSSMSRYSMNSGKYAKTDAIATKIT